jgi:glucose-1-phosphate cytidylyltransferase
MKVVILAGGFGTRLSELTDEIPKPMVKIGGRPILMHIMERYASYGFTDFIIAMGYKSEVIRDYFQNFYINNSDFSINIGTGVIKTIKPLDINWNITLIDTGVGTLTGGRIKKLEEQIGNEPFMVTYGDGLSSVNIDELISAHKASGKIATLTAVRPTAKFGELTIKDGAVNSFREKKQLDQGWINGGFFVFEPKVFDYLADDQMLEQSPLENLSNDNQLSAYIHNGFWQCMDSKRDLDYLEDLYRKGKLGDSK